MAKQFTKQLLVALLATLVPAMTSAYSFAVNGIYYNITSSYSTTKTVSVTCKEEINCGGGSSDDEATIKKAYNEAKAKVPAGYVTNTDYCGWDDDNEYYRYWVSYINSGYSGSVTIPSSVTYNGTTYSVTSIDYNAFENAISLTSVTIPSTVKTILYRAFCNCNSLTTISIPSGVTTLCSKVFYNCTSLKTVNIPSSVTTINENSFQNCTSLQLTIPTTVTTIYPGAFNNCAGTLTTNNPNVLHWSERKDIGDEDTYIVDYHYYPLSGSGFSKINLGNSITSIEDRADSYRGGQGVFAECTNLSSVTFSGNITNIGSCAFTGCTSLTSISIPSTVSTIGASAFNGCTKLAVVDFQNTSLTSIGMNAFAHCDALKTINITNLANWCNSTYGSAESSPFCNGASLYVNDEEKTSLSIPVSATKVANYAFYGCDNIQTVSIPATVAEIGSQSFGNCPSLTSINIKSGNANYSSADGVVYNADKTTVISCVAAKSGSMTIPSTVTAISDEAFNNCSKITNWILPNSINSIGAHAFTNCGGAAHIYCNVPDGNYTYSTGPFYKAKFDSIYFENGVESIGNYSFNNSVCKYVSFTSTLKTLGISVFAGGTIDKVFINCNISSYPFSGCTVKEVEIGYGVNSIGDRAFDGCKGLMSITIPSSVTTIGDYAFRDNSSLTSIVIPSSVTSIGVGAFRSCMGLSSITLPSSITSLENSTFYYCTGLTTVSIPSSVTSIGDYAFLNCI